MQIELTVIDDLKTERPDITAPLPQIARLVPVFFYLALLGAIVLSSVFFLRINEAQRRRDASSAEEKASRAELAKTKQQRSTLEAKAKRASDIMAWTETVRPLQPIVVGLTRSLGNEATISEISLNRRSDQINQLNFGIKLNGASVNQLDQMLAQFFDRGYRAYSPEQKLSRGQIDYQATLLWQPPAGGAEEAQEGDRP